MTNFACGYGVITVDKNGQPLDAWFPQPQLGQELAPLDLDLLDQVACPDKLRQVNREVGVIAVDLNEAPASVPDAYLRLHLLSHRLVQPNTINLEGIFGVLPNVVWTDAGPCAVEDFEATRMRVLASGRTLNVKSVDKFPQMTDYVVPSGVRIADGARVRLGAYLSPGTTVMHAGFVNFNAGTLGNSMVEGRISQGVVIGDGTDIGGGASTMGTLSGGGSQRVSLGQRCLLGANSGVGIALGDDCVVEAGLYVTAGTKVTVKNIPGFDELEVVSARALSGMNNLTFLRHSVSGEVIAQGRSKVGIELNADLHNN